MYLSECLQKGVFDLDLDLLSSVAQFCPILCDPMECNTPGFPVRHQLLELTQIHIHCVSDAIQRSHPLPFPSPPAFNLSSIRSFPMSQLFASGGQSFNISPSNEYSGLISFRIDWFDLLAFQGTLKSLLQLHN